VRDMLDSLMDISEAEAGVMACTSRASPWPLSSPRRRDSSWRWPREGRRPAGRRCGPLAVRADRTRTLQALANLVDNAVKFTPAGGEVVLGARRDGATVALSVTDTGIGILAEDLPHVWERLFRGDRSRSSAGWGSASAW